MPPLVSCAEPDILEGQKNKAGESSAETGREAEVEPEGGRHLS